MSTEDRPGGGMWSTKPPAAPMASGDGPDGGFRVGIIVVAYNAELIEDIIAPIEHGEADAVLGSRMSIRGEAARGGMPRYKYVGNRILTTCLNRVTGAGLSEWHSGYRAYAVEMLKSIAFDGNSDGFDFDTEIPLQILSAGGRIGEIPIPTYYGDEVSYVNGMKYAEASPVRMGDPSPGRIGRRADPRRAGQMDLSRHSRWQPQPP